MHGVYTLRCFCKDKKTDETKDRKENTALLYSHSQITWTSSAYFNRTHENIQHVGNVTDFHNHSVMPPKQHH